MPRDHSLAIVGGGIVGLATALRIMQRYPHVRAIVLEKEAEVGRHQTGHNSGVIHSGLYYAPDSLKAKLAVSGATTMVEFCQEHGIAHDICGKVVVATEEAELPRLQTLSERGVANGIPGLRFIGPEELREIEPHATGLRALQVPTTGIVDFPAAARRMAELIAQLGGEVRRMTRVEGGHRLRGKWHLDTTSGEVSADSLITCAGLHGDRVARSLGAKPSAAIVPFRGEYYQLRATSEHLVRTLIYPVPDPAFPFLGVHFTRMIAGGVEAGPNAVLAFQREGYRKTDFHLGDALDIATAPGFWAFARKHWHAGLEEMRRSWSKALFVRSLQRLVPAIQESDLVPGGSGVRAQAMAPSGELLSDFQIDETEAALHVMNAPSPAATASLAIGAYLATRAASHFALSSRS